MDLHTRKMVPVLDFSEKAKLATSFLCFYQTEPFYVNDNDTVEIEIIESDLKTSKLIPKVNVTNYLGPDQKTLNGINWQKDSRTFPLSVEESILESGIQYKKIPGEATEDSGVTKTERMQWHAAIHHQKQLSKTSLLLNRLAAQSIIEGKQDAVTGTSDPNEQYDWFRKSDNTITLGTPWSTSATATPIKDLDAAATIMEQNGRARAEFALCGKDAIEAFAKTTEVKNYADNRRYSIAWVGGDQQMAVPSKFKYMIDSGWTAFAKVSTYMGREIWLFTSTSHYQDDSLNFVDFMPAKKVVLGNTMTRCDRWFGPRMSFDPKLFASYYNSLWGVNLESVNMPNLDGPSGLIDPRMLHFDAFPNSFDHSSFAIRTQCAPIYAAVDTNAWVTIGNAAV